MQLKVSRIIDLMRVYRRTQVNQIVLVSCNYNHEQEKFGEEKIQCKYDEESDHCVRYDEIVVDPDDFIELNEEGGVDHGALIVPLDNDEVSVDLGLPEMSLAIEIRVEDKDKKDCTRVEETESRFDQHDPIKALEDTPYNVNVTKAFTKRHGVTPKGVSRRTKSSLTCNSNTNASTKTKSQKELRAKKNR